MKIFILCFLILFALNIYCQPDYSIADSSKSWTYVKGGFGSCGVCAVGNRMNKFIGDTLIGGSRYLKVFESSDSLYQDFHIIGYLFEDTISKQVFFRDTLGSEGLIYDFNVTVGDSIYVENYYTGYEAWLHCMTIDSVLIGNQLVKHFGLSIVQPDRRIHEYWLENIGSMTGVLNCGFMVAGGFREFLCCHHGDSLIYINPHHMTCYKDEFYPHVKQDQLDTAFLNEFYFFQAQITDTSIVDSISWYDLVIPSDLNFDLQNGILSGIPTEIGSFYFFVFLMNWNYPTDCIYDTLVVVDPTFVISTEHEKMFRLLPNPCADYMIAELELSEDIQLNISIFDLEGRLLQAMNGNSNSQNVINTSQLSNGIYLIEAKDITNSHKIRRKFVKM